MNEVSDEQLMVELASGNSAALAGLVDRYYNPLLGYLYRFTRDRALSEDLVQEVFITLIKKSSSSYHANKPFRPWIYTIATNLAKNHFNTAYVRHHSNDYYDETLIDKLENSTLSPEELLVKQETLKSIAEAFTQLPQEYQITLILRFYSELSLQEIATTLDIPLGTVKSRLSVGTQRLRNLLIEVKEGID